MTQKIIHHNRVLKKLLKPKIFLFFLLSALILLSIVFVRNMGNLLITNDKPTRTDLIFVLLGPVPDRAQLAAELYKMYDSCKIVTANEFQAGLDIGLAEKLKIERTAEVFKRAMILLSVPGQSIEVLDDIAASTRDEAIILRKYLEKNPEINSVTIVTSNFHTYRSKKIVEKSLSRLHRPIEIIVPDNPYSIFKPDKWWKDRYSSTMLIMEYLKLINYYVSDRFAL
jgi:uncharacterized SAM-binding protein YcdF (DUF218 family)